MRQILGGALTFGVAILSVAQNTSAHEPVRAVNPAADDAVELSRIRPPAPPEQYEDVTIKFPDGAELRVRLKSISRKGPPFPKPDRLTERLDALVSLAESGDGPAAAALWRWLRSCEREVERSQLVGPFEFCAGITREQQSAWKRWRNVALEAGDYPTMTEWASSLGNTPKSVKAWEHVWNLGYRGALAPLAIRAAAGAKDGKPDMASSYAYALADYELFRAAFGESGNAGHQKCSMPSRRTCEVR